eukprot:jgi/Ulvmu1/7774/UM004_0003.1
MLNACTANATISCDARFSWSPLNRTVRGGGNTAHFAIAPLKSVAQAPKSATTALLIRQSTTTPRTAPSIPRENSVQPLPAWLQDAATPQQPFQLPTYAQDSSGADQQGGAYSNKELDQLISHVSLHPATSSRLPAVYSWLRSINHGFDSRLCTTFISAFVHARQPAAALKIFFWMVAESEHGQEELTPTVHTYTAAMQAATAARAFSQASMIWKHAQNARVRADEQMSCTYMAALFHAGGHSQVIQMFDSIRSRTSTPPPQAYVLAIRAYTKTGDSEAALSLWDEMQAELQQDLPGQAYSAAISACAHSKDPQQAHSIFRMMVRNGIDPDCVSCTALMHAYASTGAWRDTEALLQQMHDRGVQPRQHTYVALMAAYGAADELGRAVALWRAMMSPDWTGPPAGVHALAVLLKAVGRGDAVCGASAELGEALFTEAIADAPYACRQAVGLPRVGVAGPAEVVLAKTWSQRTEEGFHATEALFSRRSSGGASPASVAAAADTRQEVRESQHIRNGEECGAAAGTAGSRWAWNGARAPAEPVAASSAGRGGGTASVDADSGGVEGPQQTPPVSMYSAGRAAAGDSARAAAAVQEDRLDVDAAEALVSELTRQGCSGSPDQAGSQMINDVVCLALMMTYLRAGQWRECVAVIGRARELGVSPTSRMVNTAMYAAACAKQPHVAEALFDSIAGEPWRVSWETLVFAYSKCGMHSEAEAAVAQMQADNTPLRDYVAVALIQAYSEAGKWRVALRIEKRLKQLGIRPTVHVLNALLTVCVRHHVYDRGVNLLTRFKVRDGPGRTRVTELLGRAVCQEEVSAIETQQVLATALSGVAAAVGGALIRSGLF